MADRNQYKLIKKGVRSWNRWREEQDDNQTIDLSHSNLSSLDLSNANLQDADLSDSNLNKTWLTEANLTDAKLHNSNLCRANLQAARLWWADLQGADLRNAILSEVSFLNANLHGANLQGATLAGANLFEADLRNANLRDANLCTSQALGTDFSGSILTGALIADWQINHLTNLDDVTCDYIFRTCLSDLSESGRLPINKERYFQPGEFTKRFQILASALETIDLTFTRGIDWQAFFQSFQKVCNSHPVGSVSIQGIERKDDIFVVRLETSADADKALIETEVKQQYDLLRATLEAQYIEKLKLKDIQVKDARETIRIERENNATLMGIVARMANNQSSKFDLRGATIGNFVETAEHGSQIQSVMNNYSSEQKKDLTAAAQEIQELLDQLSTSYPATDVPNQAIHRIRQNPQLRERLIGAMKSASKVALEKLVDHPAISIVLAAFEGASNPT